MNHSAAAGGTRCTTTAEALQTRTSTLGLLPGPAGLLVRAAAGHPGLVDVAVVAQRQDPEQQLGGLLDRLRAGGASDERLVPGHRQLAGVPVQGDEVGL